MRRLLQSIAVLLSSAALAACLPTANAGRVGGPTSMARTVPAQTSVFIEIPFAAADKAIVTVTGDGSSFFYLYLYDADGHVATGTGSTWARKTATMDVYRAGTFRIEVRNPATVPVSFVLATN